MRVLNVIMNLDPVSGGGTAERSFQMSRFLAKAGVDCTILTTDYQLKPDRVHALSGVNVVVLPCLIKRFYIPRFSFSLLYSLVNQADMVHLMNHWTVINVLIYFFAQYLGKPYVVCPAGSLPIFGRSKVFKHIFKVAVGKSIIRNAHKCIAIAPTEIAQFQQYGVKSQDIVLIPNGINPQEYLAHDDLQFRKSHNLGTSPFLLFIGRLSFEKGPDLLLHAFGKLQEKISRYQLVFVGPDQGMLTQLKRIADQYKIADKVHFLGYLAGSEKSTVYHAADLLVIPSRQEAMSIVALEAGVVGTPVLITDQCGFNEIAEIHGGKVVEASIMGIQQGILDLLGNPDELKNMGNNMQGFVFANYTWDSVVGKYLDLYKKMVVIAGANCETQ